MGDDLISEELYTWVNELELSKPKKNFARDFSDGVIVAEILKKEYPRLVELHNYAPANSFSNKMKNWGWLNERVLRKIGLEQNEAFIKEVASSKRSAVEKLLLAIKKKLDDIQEEKRKKEFMVEESITDVPYEDFKLIQEDLSKKEEELQSLQAKVAHLEALISLKDQRLADLAAQIKRCTCHNV
uniref:Sperm flagellar protein 1 n=1 Tax=Lygus hesperus TaxID=30085 RepID=A0A0A9WE29_LYGHE